MDTTSFTAVPLGLSCTLSTFRGKPLLICTNNNNARRPRVPVRHQHVPRMCEPPTIPTEDEKGGESDSRDWRDVRASLHFGSAAAFAEVSKNCYRPGHWAHPLSKPETGCFLASHPALLRPDTPYLTQSVIFIVSHSATKGSVGLVLNRPLAGTLREHCVDGVLRTVALPSDAMRNLSEDTVYIGGPHLYEGATLLLLQSQSTDLDSRAWSIPRPGISIGSLETVYKGRSGVPALPPTGPVRIFAGCVKWGAGKLEEEVESGEWFACSASPKYASEHCIQLPKPLWREIMESSGELYSKIARKTYGEDDL